MPCERELNQAVEQSRVGQAAGLPQLGIHADGGEAGDGIDLVDENFSTGAIQQKIHPRHSFALAGAEGSYRQLLQAAHLGRRKFGRHAEAGGVFQVLGGVVVEVAGRQHLARQRGAGLLVAEDRDFELAAPDGALDQYFFAEFGGVLDGRRQLAGFTHFGDADRRAQRRRLHKQREAEAAANGGENFLPLRFPRVPTHAEVGHYRQLGLQEKPLLDFLVHTHGRAQDVGADVRDTGEFQQPLHGAVLAEGAVQDREDDVEVKRGRRSFRLCRWRRRRI